ncbi:homeobox-leucine zipper protein HAT5-like [Magnolia sinica]|uniref:homeobox-leucine zipper protein HAT5-like n=1 Tax=Magnolia sinica TaxID=86752 RepID=UPI002658F6BD|nr:homeobox-leucine zipper protein HAT5-like [Magnolia sinica]
MAGGRVYGCSNMTVILQNERIPCSADGLEAFLISSSSPAFRGSRSMVNFEDVHRNTPERSFFRPLDQEETGDDDLDECFHQPEKKRRLTVDQVQFLEKNFEVENKLEPERKIQLARDLGLQPRQVAIWFQNRRARWKTKQLEKDYEALKTSFNSLKADYESLLKEKEKLKTQVLFLTDKLHLKEKDGEDSETSELNEHKSTSELNEHKSNPQTQKPAAISLSNVKEAAVPMVVPKQEDLSSANSAVFDAESPHYIDGGHSPLLEPTDSSNIFEPDQSDLSHAEEDEEDNLSKTLMPHTNHFPKLEDAINPDPPANSCNYGFSVEDHPCWFWSY